MGENDAHEMRDWREQVPENASDALTRRVRELIAAALAVVVILFTLFMTWKTFELISDDNAFSRGKDLLLVLTPFFGIVLGYYFNKVSMEGRAESAERNAEVAAAEARDATAARAHAEAEAAGHQKRAQGLRRGLEELAHEADKVNARLPDVAPVESASDGSRLEPAGRSDGKPVEGNFQEFRRALDRARVLLEQD